MAVEHPFTKKIEDIFRKIAVEVRISGMKAPVTGVVHIDKGLRLSDYLNHNAMEYLIVTEVRIEGKNQDVLFIKKEQIVTIMPIIENR